MEEKRFRHEPQHCRAQGISKRSLAEAIADMGRDLTGDEHEVVTRRRDWHIVIRTSPEGKRFPV